MLQVHRIREEKDAIVKALAKRGIDAASLVDEAIRLDEERRAAQAELDNTLAKSNSIV